MKIEKLMIEVTPEYDFCCGEKLYKVNSIISVDGKKCVTQQIISKSEMEDLVDDYGWEKVIDILFHNACESFKKFFRKELKTNGAKN